MEVLPLSPTISCEEQPFLKEHEEELRTEPLSQHSHSKNNKVRKDGPRAFSKHPPITQHAVLTWVNPGCITYHMMQQETQSSTAKPNHNNNAEVVAWLAKLRSSEGIKCKDGPGKKKRHRSASQPNLLMHSKHSDYLVVDVTSLSPLASRHSPTKHSTPPPLSSFPGKKGTHSRIYEGGRRASLLTSTFAHLVPNATLMRGVSRRASSHGIIHAQCMCHSCGSRVTPYWRDGWSPEIMLCNACGLRFQKFGERCLQCRYVPRKEDGCPLLSCPQCKTSWATNKR